MTSEHGHEHGHERDPDHDHDHEHEHDHGHGHGHEHEHEHGHGHGHGLGHSHDHTRVDPDLARSADGIRAVKLSLVGLLLTAALQVVVVLVSGSVALLADTLHNVSDTVTALPLWLAFVLTRRPPTRRFTYGYGRTEDLAGLAIVVMIALSAIFTAYEAIDRLLHPRQVEHVGWVMVAGLVGFLGNEAVALYRLKVGRRIGSAALVADGQHARADGLTSLAVVGGAIGVWLGAPLADPLVGLGITVLLAGLVISSGRGVFARLLDAVDTQIVDQVEAVLRSTPGVASVGTIRVRWVGHVLHADADVTTDAHLDAQSAHDISHAAMTALTDTVDGLAVARIHACPEGITR